MLTIFKHRLFKKKLSILEASSKAKADILYLGYGANIDPDFFSKRITRFEVLGVASLENYTFLMNTPCEYKFKGFGGIEERVGEQVFGTLYKINRDSLNLLDCLEWVPFNFYKRESLPVKIDNKYLNAEVYVPLAPRNNLYSSKAYLDLLVFGAMKMDYPKAYIEYLRSFEVKDNFLLDHEFNLNDPRKKRLLPAFCYKKIDLLREKLCKII